MSPCRKHQETHQRRGNTHTHTFILRFARCVLCVVCCDVWSGSQFRRGSWFRVTWGCRNATTTCRFCSYSNFCLVDCIYQPNIMGFCVCMCACVCLYLKQKQLWVNTLLYNLQGLSLLEPKPRLGYQPGKVGNCLRAPDCQSPKKTLFHSIWIGCT